MADKPFKYISGKVLYCHDDRGEVGRENFTISKDNHGFRTLRARCEIDEDQLLRDVVYTVDKNWLPIDAFVRLSVDGSFQGTTWYNFSDQMVECEAITRDAGRFTQQQRVDSWPMAFGAHPVANDAWGCAVFDMDNKEERQHFKNCVTTSKTPHGNTGPNITMTEKYISFHGNEELSVPAGTFKTNYFQLSWDSDVVGYDWPPIHIWTYSDDFIIVKIRWDHLKSNYLLDSLEIT